MERNDGSRIRNGFKTALVLFVGFLSLLAIVALLYFTVQAAMGRMEFCMPWIDIPGRFALLFVFYCIAGLCGYLPLPRSFSLDFFPDPGGVWRFRTWREIYAQYIRPLRHRRSFVSGNASPRSTGQERSPKVHYRLPIERRRSEPTPTHPDSSHSPEDARRDATVSGHVTPEIPDICRNSNESLMNLNALAAELIVPMVQRRSCNRRRFSPAPSTKENYREERYHDGLPCSRRRSEPIPIYPNSSYVPENVRRNIAVSVPTYDVSDISDTSASSHESFMFADCPIAGFIFPVVQRRRRRRSVSDYDMYTDGIPPDSGISSLETLRGTHTPH